MSIKLTKEAAVAVCAALKGLTDLLKEQKTASAAPTVDATVVESAKELATTMLASGLISKAAFDQTVSGLTDTKQSHLYVKRACALLLDARKASKAAAASAPAPVVGRSQKTASTVQSGQARLAEAGEKFAAAVGA